MNIQSLSRQLQLVRCRPRRCFISTLAKKKVFQKLSCQTSTDSAEFLKNVKASKALHEKYAMFMGLIQQGGGEKAQLRHTEKNKKILARDRLKLLFDDSEDVLEIGAFAGLGMEYGNVPRAGAISVIGKIHGVQCMVLANDATVKGGTVFPIGVTKQLRCQEIAEQNKIPIVYVIDSGGAFLPLQADIFLRGGRSFYNEAILSSKNIPQLAIVCGSCTAGAAYVPTMAQEALIIHKIGTIFLGGPPLVYAAVREVVTPEELGGGTMHSSVSGCTDYFAQTEPEAFEMSRDIVATFNIDPVEPMSDIEDPLYDPEELLGIIPAENQSTMDMYQVLARLVDGSRFHEFKKLYGPTLISGFAFIQGQLVGIIGNNGATCDKAALKGAHFVQLCTQRNIPLIFLQNSTQGPNEGGDKGGEMIRAHAKMMSAVACSHVPKITVIVGNSFGADNYMMCGRSFEPRFVFVWPNARICMKEPSVLLEERLEEESCRDVIEDEIASQTSSFTSSGRLWDDGIILPQHTRQVLAKCLDIIKQGDQIPQTELKINVMRM